MSMTKICIFLVDIFVFPSPNYRTRGTIRRRGFMDFTKYPLEKLSHYAASIVPGFAALAVYELTHRGAYAAFMNSDYLGYRTKLGCLLTAAFLVGITLSSFLRSLLGGIGGVYGAWRSTHLPDQAPHSHRVAPWRDLRWRLVLKRHLGSEAPADLKLLNDEVYAVRKDFIMRQQSPTKEAMLSQLEDERLRWEINERHWANWYDHFHTIVLSTKESDFHWNIRVGLLWNLATASLFIAVSAPFLSVLRNPWVLVPSLMWIAMFAAFEYAEARNLFELWSTLQTQTQYIAELKPLGAVETAKSASAGE